MKQLESYKAKRDFDRTREPTSGEPGRSDLRFVVQKHAARRLHYDFRLEFDGTLKSWPVPKGPSLDPQEKRLAVMVEDHPLDYATFEGVIAHGNYGAGQVIVWDAGVYSPDEGGRFSFGDRDEADERMRQGLEAGKLSFTLRGRKLRGSWTLVRTARSPKDWLLIKHKDRYADPGRDVLLDDRSVQSGLTIEELKAGRLPDPVRSGGEVGAGSRYVEALGKKAAFPKRIKPMLARLADRPFSHPDWVFEPKLDGFRVLALLRKGDVKLHSRTGIDLTEHFPEVVAELESQPEDELVIDGEIVALDENGRPDFGLLHNRAGLPKMRKIGRPGVATIKYYAFDLLYIGGTDLQRVPLFERKALLAQVLAPGDRVEMVEYVEADGEVFFDAAIQLGLEGMVAKRRDSAYEPGARSASWIKIKAEVAQEFVVGAYTKGSGSRSSTFGALLLGYYEGDELRYAGKVGSGFDRETLEGLREMLALIHADRSPFAGDPELDKMDAQWVRPELVARVKFAQWTVEDRLRAPVFVALRSDLTPTAVVREQAETTPPSELSAQRQTENAQTLADAVLDQLSGSEEALILEAGGHRISLTNLNKPLWPAVGGRPPVTKGDMIRYYARMGPTVLPHLRHRPLTLTRYPDGIEGESFYQKHWEHDLPEFVETVQLYSSHKEGVGEYILVNNLPTLIWLAQLADLELHPWQSRTVREPDALHLTTDFAGSKSAIEGSTLNYPDVIVFDLDPYIYSGKEKAGDEPELNRRAFAKVGEIARELKSILDELSLSSFLKTSGKTGLHIYVPVLRQYDYKVTRKTCELVGRFLMQSRPNDVTMEWTVSKRSGKIFLDHNQNVRGKNMASIYSLRPLPGAPVSTPLRWDELGEVYPTDFTIDTVPERVDALGDLWAGVLDAKHDLRRLLETEE